VIESRQKYYGEDKNDEPVGKPTEGGQTLFLFGTLRIEVTHGLQTLKETLNLSFIFGSEKLVSGRRQLAAIRATRQDFSPELTIRNSINQGILGTAPQVTQEALACIDIAGVNQQNAPVTRKRKVYDQGSHPGSPIKFPDFGPRNDSAAKH
jgi:hypothetical protein